MGKGSKKRKPLISQAEADANWDAIFSSKSKRKQKLNRDKQENRDVDTGKT